MKLLHALKRPRNAFMAAGVLSLVAGAVFASMTMGHRGPPQPDLVIDAATRQQVLDAVTQNLADHYVFADKGAAMAKHLQQMTARGEFNAITSADKLAQTLTDSLQDYSQDRHLSVQYSYDEVPEESADGEPSAEQQQKDAERMQRLNYGFENVGRLQFNIGYIDLRNFSEPAKVGERMAAAMALLADTKALIIDLRKNHGGDPETVALIASYFFDERTHLNDIYTRDEGDKAMEMWTTLTPPGLKYGATRPVYVLTSSETFSAGEDFSYAMKNTRRATLIGETSGGGAHPMRGYRINAHFEIGVPFGRSLSPITKTDWEGVGVVPDIKVDADDALNVAQLQVLNARLKTETDPDWRDALQERIAELD